MIISRSMLRTSFLILAIALYSPLVGQEPLALEGHTDAVTSVSYAPAGDLIVTGSYDKSINVFQTSDGALLRTLTGHTGQVFSVAVSPNGRQLISTSRDGTAKLWDLYVPTPLATWEAHEGAVSVVEAASDGKWLASGSAAGSLKILDPVSGEMLFDLIGHADGITRAAIAADGLQLASADAAGNVILWNPIVGKPLGTLGAHTAEITGLAFHPGGEQLLTSASNGIVKRWTLPLIVPREVSKAEVAVVDAIISADGKLLVSATAEKVFLQALDAEAPAKELADPPTPITRLALSADATLVAAASDAGIVKLWAAADGADKLTLRGHTGPIHDMTFSADGTHLGTAGEDGTIRVWRHPQAATDLPGHTMPVNVVAPTADGKLIATGGDDKIVRLFNAADGTAAGAIEGHAMSVSKIAFTADGKQFASADAAGTIQIATTADGKVAAQLFGPSAKVTGLSYLPNGEALLSSTEAGSLTWWKLPTASAVPLAGHTVEVSHVAASADTILTGSTDGSIRRFKLADGTAAGALAGHEGPVTALATSSALAVAGSETGDINWWTLADGKPGIQLGGHDGAVTVASVHPGGESFATGADDGVIRIWRKPLPSAPMPGTAMTTTLAVFNTDRSLIASAGTVGGKPAVVIRATANGAAKGTLLGHAGAVTAIAFSADGKRVVTGSADKTCRVWDLTDPKFPEIASFAEHTNTVTATTFNADATQVFSGDATGAIRHWTVADLSEVRSLAGHTGAIAAIELAGATLVTGSADQTIRTWNVSNGQAGTNVSHGAAVTALAISADGKQFASGGADKTVKLFAITGGAPTATLAEHGGPINSIAFDATGNRIAAASPSGTRIWSTSGVPLERFAIGEKAPLGVAFDAKGDSLLIGDAGHVLHAQPIHLTAAIPAHEGVITGLEYSLDGTHLFSAGADKKVQRWNVADGKLLGTFAGPTEATHDLDLSTDGKHLVAGCADMNVYIWPIAAPSAQPVPTSATFSLATPVQAVTAGVDGARIAATGDNEVTVFDSTTGLVLERLRGHTMPVNDISLVGTGDTILSVSADKTAVMGKLAATRVVAVSEMAVNSLSVSTDGTLAATASADGKLKLLNTADGALAHEATPPAVPTSVALRGDKAQLAAGLTGTQVAVYPLTAQGFGTIAPIELPAPAKSVCYHDTTGKLTVAGDDAIRVFDSESALLLEESLVAEPAVDAMLLADGMTVAAATGSKAVVQPLALTHWIAAHEGAATGVALLPDGTSVISAGADKTIKQWNLADATVLRPFAGAAEAIVSLDLSADGKLLAAATADNTLLVYDASATPAANTPAMPTATITLPSEVSRINVSADGSRIATSGVDGLVRVWEVATGRELERFAGHVEAVHAATFAADGQTLASAGADGTTRVWNVAASQLIVADETGVGEIAYVGDGTQFASVGNEMLVKLWAADGTVAKQLVGAKGALTRMAIRLDATQLAAVDTEGNLMMWSLADGTLAHSVESVGIVNDLAYSGGGLQLAAAGADNHLRVYRSEDAALLQDQLATAPLLTAAFSASGKEIITGSEDKSIASWTYASPQPIGDLTGHTGAIYAGAYNSDGTIVATAGADGTVRLWDASTGAAIRQLSGHEGAVYSARFVADGKQLLTAGIDGTARLFDANSGQAIRSFVPVVEEGKTPSPLFDATMNAQGTLVAAGGSEKVIHTWNAANGQPATAITGHVDAVYRLDFQAARLLSLGHAGNLHAWNPANGQQAAAITTPSVTFSSAISPDGKSAVVGCADGSAYVIALP